MAITSASTSSGWSVHARANSLAIEASHTDSEVFQAFLDEAAKCVQPTRKRNILIIDNASWHKKKSLNWHCFEPLFLPPYSPDLNAIELLWLLLKARWFNNIHCKTVDALIEHTDRALLDLIHHPKQVAHTTRSFGTDF
jgi:transposase